MNIAEKNAIFFKKKYNTNDPFKICQNLNIFVKEYTLPPYLDGLSIKTESQKIIVLNNTLPEYEKTIVLARELGHCILHDFTNNSVSDLNTYQNILKFEKEADGFAAYLLLDNDDMKIFNIDAGTDILDILNFSIIPKKLLKLGFE